MNEREFIKLVRELQKLQLKVLGEECLSIEIGVGRTKFTTYINFNLFIYKAENNIKELYSKTLYSNPLFSNKTKDDNDIVNNRILNEMKKKVTASLLLYGGRKRSEAERSDAPIK